ncbi:MAG: response regulator [bacterium]|nr:response regulator [bacterium]
MLPILIIDDQPALQEVLQVLFEIHDLPCGTASTAEEPGHRPPRARRGGDRRGEPLVLRIGIARRRGRTSPSEVKGNSTRVHVVVGE